MREDPGKCFYYLNGLCCASSSRIANKTASACILDSYFLDNFVGLCTSNKLEQYEIDLRKRLSAVSQEAIYYFTGLQRYGEDYELSPRMLYIFRYLQPIIRTSQFCNLESSLHDSKRGEIVEWLLSKSI
ncbi:hypothetical protein ACFL5F_07750 [Planctomycetota bacterium]